MADKKASTSKSADKPAAKSSHKTPAPGSAITASRTVDLSDDVSTQDDLPLALKPSKKTAEEVTQQTSTGIPALGVITVSEKAVYELSRVSLSKHDLLSRHVSGDHGDGVGKDKDGFWKSSYKLKSGAEILVMTDGEGIKTRVWVEGE